MIAAERLAIGRGGTALLAPATFTLPGGECWAVVGRNGSGKSTLLATLAGLMPALGGEVRVEGKTLGAWARPELARRLGFLPQHQPAVFPYTAEEFVAFGRTPFLQRASSWRSLWSLGVAVGREDSAAIEGALRALDLDALRGRALTGLSGGEVQRVCIAQLLAQSTDILLLDEPLAHLDLLHQVAVMRTLRGLADAGRAVALVTHDLSLAWRYCHRFLVLGPGSARLVARDRHEEAARALAWAYAVGFAVDGNGPRLTETEEMDQSL